MFVNVVLLLPVEQEFTYLVREELKHSVMIGKRVLVPFGRKILTGVIVGAPETTQVKGLKYVIDILDDKPIFSSEIILLTKWISEYYLSPWGEVLKIAMPHGLKIKSNRIVKVIASNIEELLKDLQKTSPSQFSVLAALKDRRDISVSQLQKRSGVKSIYAVLNELKRKGIVAIEERIKGTIKPKTEKFISLSEYAKELVLKNTEIPEGISKRQFEMLKLLNDKLGEETRKIEMRSFLKENKITLSTIKAMVRKNLVEVVEEEVYRQLEKEMHYEIPDITLNSNQQYALSEIEKALWSGKFRVFLLHGVTGSCKTQVYIEAIRKVLSAGKTAIVLVPEISLTPQTVARFRAHFGADVTVMHSQMSAGERYDAWRMAYEGKAKIVIGPRSAIFAPLKNIGLVVVDEEHESSYKQFDMSPRYNARDVALMRAMHTNAVVVLGSATPSLESYANALQGKYTLLELPERVDRAQLPAIKIIDMVNERREILNELKEELKKSDKPYPKHFKVYSISRLLQSYIASRLEKKEGVILLQNRRGYSHIMECYDCGYVEKCDNCEVSLTYHITKKHLRCHYCGFVKAPPSVCPKCGSIEIRMHSFGTQQVQEELQELFPNAVVLRMDKDTTTRKGAHVNILNQFEKGDADILLGTQMVAKGLDFPRVTLVGVVSADTQLLLPDFRASESTFQLLTQVAGRAGRSHLAGEVVIQTTQPEHYSIKYAGTHDFRGFYSEELKYRKELDYPPFSRIILVEFSGDRESEVEHHAKKFAGFLDECRTGKSFKVLGPADAAIPKLKNKFRKHIVIKALKDVDPSGASVRSVVREAKTKYESSALGKNKNIKMVIDVDPQGMM